jgi:hypothetical protein
MLTSSNQAAPFKFLHCFLNASCRSQVPEPHDTCPCVSLVLTTYTTMELLWVTHLKQESSTSPYISIPVVMRDELQGSRKSDWYQLTVALVYITPFSLPSIKRLLPYLWIVVHILISSPHCVMPTKSVLLFPHLPDRLDTSLIQSHSSQHSSESSKHAFKHALCEFEEQKPDYGADTELNTLICPTFRKFSIL